MVVIGERRAPSLVERLLGPPLKVAFVGVLDHERAGLAERLLGPPLKGRTSAASVLWGARRLAERLLVPPLKDDGPSSYTYEQTLFGRAIARPSIEGHRCEPEWEPVALFGQAIEPDCCLHEIDRRRRSEPPNYTLLRETPSIRCCPTARERASIKTDVPVRRSSCSVPAARCRVSGRIGLRSSCSAAGSSRRRTPRSWSCAALCRRCEHRAPAGAEPPPGTGCPDDAQRTAPPIGVGVATAVALHRVARRRRRSTGLGPRARSHRRGDNRW